MKQKELVNICDRCGGYNDFMEVPDGETWFICRRCGSTQPKIEECDPEVLLDGTGEIENGRT